jgi:glycine cleavage system aminomethyltransferase T
VGTGRLEKGFRAYGTELDNDYNPVEADMLTPRLKAQDFIGREALERALGQERAAVCCTLTVDDHTSPRTGEKRYMLGRQPIVTPDGKAITDRMGRQSYANSAGMGPSLGKYLLLSYLPPEHAVEGTKLAVQYFGELYPVTVARVGSKPLFDPENERVKA